ncbi:HWE histidine kinase domain-containing protein [Humitalea sp. 24SJ18S-53]|uniref:HWE histidine kinase domain-containing protein n=1 Tax=Humitalea sp. 24SJ18S-53 TaxID=3422307 RepID=UPI003D675E53
MRNVLPADPATDDDLAEVAGMVPGPGFLPEIGGHGAAGIERVRLAMDNLGLAFYETDLLRDTVKATANAFAIFGLPIPEPEGTDVPRRLFWNCFHPDDQDPDGYRTNGDTRRERTRDTYFERVRIIHQQTRQIRWLEVMGRIFGPLARRTHIVGMCRDVTALVEAEERQRLLSIEVNHRANNVLAVAQALVAITRADDVPGFRAAVQARILALARTHDLLARSAWQTDLRTVVVNETAAFGGQVVVSAAPVLALRPSVVQSFAMLLHELAINAAKHGALSAPQGQVAVTIALQGTEVALTWREHGGPPIASAPDHAGTGTALMRRLVQAMHGTLASVWLPDGLRADLRLPLKHCTG